MGMLNNLHFGPVAFNDSHVSDQVSFILTLNLVQFSLLLALTPYFPLHLSVFPYSCLSSLQGEEMYSTFWFCCPQHDRWRLLKHIFIVLW